MNYELIIIRYGEIALKGKATRIYFENILLKNIENALKSNNLQFIIKKEWGRIYIYTEQINKCINILKKIFGIISISPAVQTLDEIDSISKTAINASREILSKEKSFAVRVTRTGEHEFSSQDVAIRIGNDVVKATKASVNLNKPDLELYIEVRNKKSFVFTKKIRCEGGLPLGTQGNFLVIIDRPESILASWYLMRRGCKSIFLNMRKSYNDILKSFIDNWFIQTEILINTSKNNFYKEINKIAIDKNCVAIVTSHFLDTLSKTTLSEIKQLKKYTQVPILHPLISMNLKEIHNKCKEIGIPI